MTTLNEKIYYSGLSALVFLGVSLPQVYQQTNPLLQSNGSCPNYKSKLLHMVVFFALSLGVMQFAGKSDKTLMQQSKYALYGALLYFFLSSNEMYSLTTSVVGDLYIDGCPTIKGIAVHSAVYMLSLIGLMSLN
jgi:hypothetical protein